MNIDWWAQESEVASQSSSPACSVLLNRPASSLAIRCFSFFVSLSWDGGSRFLIAATLVQVCRYTGAGLRSESLAALVL